MQGRVTSGIRGLDEVLRGGYIRDRAFLVRGKPGVGKTLVGVHFLNEGVERGESTLFISFGTSREEILADAGNFGFDLSPVEFLDMSPTAEYFREKQVYDIFAAPEIEREEYVDAIMKTIAEVNPDRVFIDPITELRSLTPDRQQFREQARSLLYYLKQEGATVLFSSESGKDMPDTDLQYISDGVLHLRFGPEFHQMEVTKLRGSAFERGPHFISITETGIDVFSVILPKPFEPMESLEQLSSGNAELDRLLHGGIERSSSTIISGPTGVGKTTIAANFVPATAAAGRKSVIYLFEEAVATFLRRAESTGVPLTEYIEDGLLELRRVEPYEHAPEQFARIVRQAVEDGASTVIIDGLEGYLASIEGRDEELIRRLHALVSYVRNNGGTPIITTEVHNITGEFRATDHRASYLADNILYLTYYEYDGTLNRAFGVLKKRSTDCERTLHEFNITEEGLVIGKSLSDLRGVLWGAPGVLEMMGGDD